MDAISTFVVALAGHSPFFAYLAVFIATALFGNIAAFISLWLAFRGTLGEWGAPLVIVAIFAGSASGDAMWYFIGRKLRSTRFGNWFKNRIPHHEKIEHHILHRGRRWILFGKFTYGMNVPVLFLTGWTHINFREFFRRSLSGIALWLPVIVGVSYVLYTSLSPLAGIATLKHFEVLFLGGLAAFLVVQWALAKIAKKVLEKEE